MPDITGPVIIVASFGNATVKRTLYGPVSSEREDRERIDTKRRAEQLDTSRPDPKIKRREERRDEKDRYSWQEEHRETNRW